MNEVWPMRTRHVYGPVPSRRLGLSLGVDLLPRKTCCYDCLYCQVGRTTELCTKPETFVDPGIVLSEVLEALASEPRPRIITLAGSGEPTLYAPLAELLSALKQRTDLPVALITNSGLLWQPEVLSAALLADQVYPSLDAADEETFRLLNRPAPGLDFLAMKQGLADLCRHARGLLRLEIMLVGGVNDSPASLEALSTAVRDLGAVAVDLNTPVRPAAYPGARPLSPEQMAEARLAFSGSDVQVIAHFRGPAPSPGPLPRQALERIRETVARRPCTAADLASALNMPTHEVEALLRSPEARAALTVEDRDGRAFYRLG